MTDYTDFSLEDLIKTRQKMAQTVNRQMRRWKEAGLEGKRSAFTRYAEPYLRQYGRQRFSTAKSPVAGRTEYQQRRAEISELHAMERLMAAQTYRIKGFKEQKRRAIQGLAQAAGIDITTPEGKKFIEEAAESLVASDQWGWLKRTVGSEAILEVSRQIAKGNATRDEVFNKITEMRARDLAGRTYIDARGRPAVMEPKILEYEETVEDPETGETTIVKREYQESIYSDLPLEDVYEELGFSEYQNVVGEDYEE